MHGPGPGRSNHGPNLVKRKSQEILGKAGTNLLIGDFNCYDTFGCKGEEFDNKPVTWRESRNPFYWYGNPDQGTTYTKKKGLRKSDLTTSPLDRVYINVTNTYYSINVSYDDTRGLYEFTDHIGVCATIGGLGPSSLFLEEEPIRFKAFLKKPLKVHLQIPPTLQQLSQTLQQQVNTQQFFVLNDGTLGSEGLNNWMQNSSLKSATITIYYNQTIPQPINNQLIITGATSNLLNKTGLAVKVIFTATDNKVTAFAVQAVSTQSLSLNNLFPEIKADPLGETIFENPSFTFGVNLASIQKSPGLQFSGNLPLDEKSPCSWVKKLWGTLSDDKLASHLPISGPIAYANNDQKYLTVDLTGSMEGKATLPILGLGLSTSLRAIYNSQIDEDIKDVKSTPLPDSGFYLKTELSINSTRTLPITIGSLNGDSYLLTFGDNSYPISNLNELNPLLTNSNSDWQSILKPIQAILNNLTLQYVAIVLQVQPKLSMPWIELQIVNPRPWELFKIGTDFTISLEGLAINLASYPSGDGSRGYDVSVHSNLSFGPNLDFEVRLLLNNKSSDWTLSGALTLKNSGDLKDLMRKLTGQELPEHVDHVFSKIFNLTLDYVNITIQHTNSHYNYNCEVYGSITLLGIHFDNVACQMSYAGESKATTFRLIGQVSIGPVIFNADADFSSTQGSHLTMSWVKNDSECSLNQLLQYIDSELILPEEFNLSLKEATITYDFGEEKAQSKRLLVKAIFEIAGQTAKASLTVLPDPVSPTAPSIKIISFSIVVPKFLFNLPVVGNVPSPLSQVLVIGSSHELDQEKINAAKLLTLVSGNLSKGIQLQLQLIGRSEPVHISLKSPSPSRSLLEAKDIKEIEEIKSQSNLRAENSAAFTYWIKLGKSFGPLEIQRIGLSYQQRKLWLKFDSSINMGPLTAQLEGLGIGIPLAHPDQISNWDFSFDGLGLACTTGPISFSGDFYKDTSNLPTEIAVRYNGGAMMQVAGLTVAAIGSYAEFTKEYRRETNQDCSVFVFAQINYPFGGPPFFYVTGFAGGFGYNQRLVIPTPEQVVNFPLVRGSSDSKNLGSNLLAVQKQLLSGDSDHPAWIIPKAGTNWLAIGIDFNSFELLKTKALLVVQFGKNFQLAVLGRSSLQLPKAGPHPIAYVEMGLEAIFDPEEGLLSMIAVLSPNSYVLTPDCHLRGGFALSSWFKDQSDGARAGDFVTTLGGYHPGFNVPYYPKVPRLGFFWQVSDSITIEGEAYCALTNTAIMMGGLLQAVLHSGSLKAWLKTSADFLVEWHPFHYEAQIEVDVGASYRLDLGLFSTTLKAELGAKLTIYGPPTGGNVHVEWFIISFDIPFGADRPEKRSLIDWANFRNFLPKNTRQTDSKNSEQKNTPSLILNRLFVEQGLLDQEPDNEMIKQWVGCHSVSILPKGAAIPLIGKPEILYLQETKEGNVKVYMTGKSKILSEEILQSLKTEAKLVFSEEKLRSIENPELISKIISICSHTRWIVRKEGFIFYSESVIPITSIQLNNVEIPSDLTQYPLNIKPMGLQNIIHQHHITLEEKIENEWRQVINADQWKTSIITHNVPNALWGVKESKAKSSEGELLNNQLLPDRWMGVKIQAPKADLGVTPGPMDMKKRFTEILITGSAHQNGSMPLSNFPVASPTLQIDPQIIKKISDPSQGIAAPSTNMYRNKLADSLQKLGLFQKTSDLSEMKRFGNSAAQILLSPPVSIPTIG